MNRKISPEALEFVEKFSSADGKAEARIMVFAKRFWGGRVNCARYVWFYWRRKLKKCPAPKMRRDMILG